MAVPRQEKAYERHAWIILFAGGIIGLIYALYFLFVGIPPDSQLLKSVTGSTWEELVAKSPGVATYLRYDVNRVLGLSLLGWSIAFMAIARTSYRKGERWAWYVLWYWPVYFVAFIANNVSFGGGTWPIFIVFVFIVLTGLLLPYRKFFPKKQAVTS